MTWLHFWQWIAGAGVLYNLFFFVFYAGDWRNGEQSDRVIRGLIIFGISALVNGCCLLLIRERLPWPPPT